ncbi:MAG: T9SS type A sorting domain-containing protein [Sporocytophaga sp.]|uniref:T9SS type A sorting domain-containing protein n=1 Tax=Sporocytophaga sp. TaxID=2231183 RepID=UPI001B1F4C92|nr:T9SS type A sorting domain-containing protein [Sporocytophaga sp.]MBO9702720.1 T9SS type A sorting domain-containing protein [Sporocytophaga sp.]
MRKIEKKIQLLFILSCSLFGITFAQPTLMKSIPVGSTNFVSTEGRLFFTTADSLWTSNGTPASTYFIKKTGESFVRLTNFRLGTFIYFTTLQSDGKTALWRTNGTGANTTKIAAYSKIDPYIVYDNYLYLGINDGIHGYELWKINLSNTLTMVKDIVPGSGNGLTGNIIISSNTLYFAALAGPGGINIWKSNGTEPGTLLAVDLTFTDLYNNYLQLEDVNGKIFFSREYFNTNTNYNVAELWVSNGTNAGTYRLLKDSSDYYQYDIRYMTSFNNKLYFSFERDLNWASVMYSDGTVSGTKGVHYFQDEDYTALYQVKENLTFTSRNNNGAQTPLKKVDGLNNTVVDFHAFDLLAHQTSLASTGKLLFYNDASESPFSIDELSQSDLTPENSRMLRDIFGISYKNAGNATPSGENIYFTTETHSNSPFRVLDVKLWFYNPTRPSNNVPYFTLVDAGNDTDIAWLKDGDYVIKSETPDVNIRYNPVSTPGSVVFKLNGGIYRTENQSPYALAGDTDGDYNVLSLSSGVYELTATPYSSSGGGGIAGTPLSIHFTVRDSSVYTPPARMSAISDNPEPVSLEAYPNPSTDYFTFSLLSKENGIAKAEIYKMDGSLVQTILEGNVSKGQSLNFIWNGGTQQQGMYLCKFSCGTQQMIKKIILVK